ncbi:MAG: J domain-containing protein [Dehalococcoidia bacterium]|nr:J domain-containing protein [Dehalococcoidia bacterium]
MEVKDYYEVLGCNPNSSAEEIKKSYRELAGKLHPDLNPPRLKQWSERQMRQINEAYEVLGDQNSKARYDEARTNGTFVPPRYAGTPIPGLSRLTNPLMRYVVTALIITLAFALLPVLFRTLFLNPRGLAIAALAIGVWIAISRLRRSNRGA